MSKRRVVITGLGLISPVGNDVETGWANLVAGKSGVGPITRFDASPFPSRIAGEVRDFNPADWMNAKELRHFDTFIHYGVAAGLQAFRDSGLEVTGADWLRHEFGCAPHHRARPSWACPGHEECPA